MLNRAIALILTGLALFLSLAQLRAQTPRTFVHPGAVNGKADLDFVKEKIEAGEDPWTSEFNKVKGKATGGTNALTYINSSSGDAGISNNDAVKAYANALTWYFTGQEIYAQRAITMLNAWSILQGFNAGSDQDKLQAGWIGALFGPAAEIMRGYPGWGPEDMASVQEMFRRAFYPQLNLPSSWNGNVDLTQIDAMLNIAVFNEDETLFNSGLERLRKRAPSYFYLTKDEHIPPINGDGGNIQHFWHAPTLWVDGLTQETCRDNNHHAQFALASALHAAEVAWNQGVDLYGEHADRFAASMELMATQFLTGEMQGTCTNNVTTGNIFSTWEVGYNHYHNRMGMMLPATERLLEEQVRPRGSSVLNIFHETLTHADLEIFKAPLLYISSRIDSSSRLISAYFTEPLILTEIPSGFEVLANDTAAIIISGIEIDPDDSRVLYIYLNREVKVDERITLSYDNGGVLSPDSVMLTPFFDEVVEIRLPGAEQYITIKIQNIESGLNIDSCLVTFNSETQYTDANGEVSFRAFKGLYEVGAWKKHLVPVENQNLTIVSDTLIPLFLDSVSYRMDLQVEHYESRAPLSAVEIAVNSQIKHTNFEGETSFLVHAGLHATHFIKSNYLMLDSVFKIESDTILKVGLLQSHAKVKFKVKNGLQPVNHALVLLGQDSLRSNHAGICSFESVEIGNFFDFTVSKENFFPAQGNLKLVKDTLMDVQMSKSVANIEFQIDAENGNLQNASVILGGDTALINPEGSGRFYLIPINQIYTYQIVSDNYPRYSDSIIVSRDTLVRISLLATLLPSPLHKGDIHIYPNPATNQVTIEVSDSHVDAIEVFDYMGKKVLIETFNIPQRSVSRNLNVAPGIYLIKIKSGGHIYGSLLKVD